MSIEDNGGAAFPTKGGMVFYVPSEYRDQVNQEVEKLREPTEGMTLRDYFAAKILQGELAAQDYRADGKGTGVMTCESMQDWADRCYMMADAMLEARKK